MNIMNKIGKKIGIFGGTFDPIHLGHLFLAETACDRLGLDKILFMPNPAPYHRKAKETTPLEDRIAMTELAISDNSRFAFSDFEIKLEGPVYTAETLGKFHEAYPDAEIYFILGGDSLFTIEYWKDPEKIFSIASILCGKREDQQRGATGSIHAKEEFGLDSMDHANDTSGRLDSVIDKKIEHLKEKFGARIYNIHVPNIEISSSDIKQRVRDGRSIKYCTPDKVIDYINEHNLYRG